ncbi:MAG: hypothetical protein AAF585_10445 [Verrucomicrobiota bacterium]
MSDYSESDLRAVNLLSLILVAIGAFFILTTAIAHVDNRPPEAKLEGAAEIGSVKKAKVVSVANGYFVKRYILGSVFVLCGVALHFGLKQNAPTRQAAAPSGDSVEPNSEG